jgi:gluconate 2-dehydrogenase gamma chain
LVVRRNNIALLAATDRPTVHESTGLNKRGCAMSGKITRRIFVSALGAASVAPGPALLAASTAADDDPAKTPQSAKVLYTFFNLPESQFIEAACERLIPADELGGGALAAGVPNYLDKQLGGSWGNGERLYRSGPWFAGTPSQGYQLPFTPAELFRTALRAINRGFESRGKHFSDLAPEDQDVYLKTLESGGEDLDGVPSAVFFEQLLKMTVEGFFSDPVYGGNRDMVGWRMVGFPGAYADYYEAIDRHGVKYERAPISLSEDRSGHLHPDPNIPAQL